VLARRAAAEYPRPSLRDRTGHPANNRQADQPENADRNRVLQLSDGPVLESGGGDSEVIGCGHCLCLCLCQIENLRANSIGKAGRGRCKWSLVLLRFRL